MLSFSKPMSEAALRQFVAKALDKDWIREGFHSEVENAYRNISDEDIRYGLERRDWCVEGDPEPGENSGEFKYVIRTVDIELAELHVVVLPHTQTGTLKIITKY
jgi:hypothetical protein